MPPVACEPRAVQGPVVDGVNAQRRPARQDDITAGPDEPIAPRPAGLALEVLDAGVLTIVPGFR
jgi:hypothetical protein